MKAAKSLLSKSTFYVLVKGPLVHVSVSHKQNSEVKSKWNEQEISLDFKLRQIKFHRGMLTNKFNSIKQILIVCLAHAGTVIGIKR